MLNHKYRSSVGGKLGIYTGDNMQELTQEQLSRLIEMAWEDRTPFEAIALNYQLNEADVIRLMRRHLKPKAFRNWRARVSGRKTKHLSKRLPGVLRGYCPTQYKQRGH